MELIILNSNEISRALMRIAHEVLERNKGSKEVVLVGIRTGGVYLAQRLSRRIQKIEGDAPPVGALDITLYRDDLANRIDTPNLKKTDISFNMTDKKVVLVDDVLYTGRTIRAALDSLIDLGRPKEIQLAVLIDRGHRELPIRADYVGKNLPTAFQEKVSVRLEEAGEEDRVILERNPGGP
ncbi:MAG: bifunctional pyr operon transcriptional regulator/uracil phosphoribosyltransferase PyrR [Nitrospiria bacterium]